MQNKLTYWQFLMTNKYPHFLLIGLAVIASGFIAAKGLYDWGFVVIELIGTGITTSIIIGGFIIHWKEYSKLFK